MSQAFRLKQAIEDAVIAGEFRPGDRLDEASLAVHKLVAALESYLEKLVSENNLSGVEAGRNFLAVGEISFPEQIAVPLDAQQGSLF